MTIHTTIQSILEQAQAGKAPTREECISLLQLPEQSYESALLRATADQLSRAKFGHAGMLLAQIGIEIAPCRANCKFCSFARDYTDLPVHKMSVEDILLHGKNLSAHGNLHSLFLMTMHDFDFENLLQVTSALKKHLPAEVDVVVNIGDFDPQQANELHAAGVNGAYHVRRLREGIDNTLDAEERLQTIENIRKAGMDWYTCCEPIGPEHSPQEIVDQIFEVYAIGCFQNAAMRRVALPKSPLSRHGQISELRLAQIVSVVFLAGLECKELKSMAVHEPNELGLLSGANCIYAEAGANPRDTEAQTERSRGCGLADCERLFMECGYAQSVLPSGKLATLQSNGIQLFA
ncbi:MAG: radical SAM protein [Chloroflexi bacterium]|nr:radical SAM protein [Chloroflexota bacterium]